MTLIKLKKLVDELLIEYAPTTKVILSKDGEGNGYSPLSENYCYGIYKSENSYSGEFISADWDADEACYDSEEAWEEDKNNSELQAIVLWPIN